MSRGKIGPSLPELPEGRAYLSSPGDRSAGGRVFSTHVRHSNIRAWPSRLRISLLRLGASRRNRSLSTGVAVSPPPKKKNSSGLPTASSAARAGVGPCVRGRQRATRRPSPLSPTPSRPSRAPWRSWPRTASCRRRPWPPCGRSACGYTSPRGAAPPGRPPARARGASGRARTRARATRRTTARSGTGRDG